MSAKRLVAALVAFAGATAFTACSSDWPMTCAGTGAVSQAAARSTELLRTGAWLIVSLAGTAFGIALSTSLTTMLR